MKNKNLLGYVYLVHILKTTKLPFRITRLYEETAKKFNTTSGAVERSIRYYLKKNNIEMTTAEYIAEELDKKGDYYE